jgi:hypothetical protein
LLIKYPDQISLSRMSTMSPDSNVYDVTGHDN